MFGIYEVGIIMFTFQDCVCKQPTEVYLNVIIVINIYFIYYFLSWSTILKVFNQITQIR